MKKLRHTQTYISLPQEEYYMIAKDDMVFLSSWNYFLSFENAESCLLQNFIPEKGVVYTIIRTIKTHLTFKYQ
jgi:hypothetical protein